MKSITIRFIFAGIVVAGGVASLACIPAQGVSSGKKAPAFSGKATDEKNHSLDGQLEKGLTVLYFIKEGCPVNHQAAPFVQKLFAAYEGKANLLGIYNGDVKGAESWTKRYKATFPLMEDPSLKTIRAYGALYSPWIVVVKKDGTVGKVFEGAAPKELGELNKMLAANLSMEPPKLDFAGSPTGGG
jgi:peroxiredoxin